MKCFKFRDVSRRLTTFLIDENFKSLQVFSYTPDESFPFEKTTHDTPINALTLSACEKLRETEIYWFYCIGFSYLSWPALHEQEYAEATSDGAKDLKRFPHAACIIDPVRGSVAFDSAHGGW